MRPNWPKVVRLKIPDTSGIFDSLCKRVHYSRLPFSPDIAHVKNNLMFSTLGKIVCKRHFETFFFLIFPENML